jgi:transposase InsO family protein
MPSDKAFRLLMAKQGAGQTKIEVIARVRGSDPARSARSLRSNVSGYFPSDKMALSLGFESQLELFGCLGYELDPGVFEFYDQPPIELKVGYHDKLGRARAVRTIPDFLVIENDDVFLDEWKSEEELLGLSVSMPDRYIRDDGGWRSPPAEEAAQRVGLRFRIRTLATLSPGVRANGKFLRDYYLAPKAQDQAASCLLAEIVKAEPGLTVASLLARAGLQSADELYRLIARGEVHVDLASQRLADSFYIKVYPSPALASAIERVKHPWSRLGLDDGGAVAFEPGAVVDWHARRWLVVGVTDTVVELRSPDAALLPLARAEAENEVRSGAMRAASDQGETDEIIASLRVASPDALAEATRRYGILERFWQTRIAEVHERTLRDWQRAYYDAEDRTGFGYVGLVPKTAGRRAGERTLNADVEAIVADAIKTFYRTPAAPTKLALHGRIQEECERAHHDAPSYSTLLARLGDLDQHGVTRDRRGEKAAAQVADYFYYLASDTPRHGERPWELAHIDHTQLDVMLVDSESGITLGKPWLTLVLDAYSRRVLAYWLTFDEPSYRSVLMAMRRCVARWGRLPEEIVVDGGTELSSATFEKFLALYRVAKKLRPPAKARFGAVLERFFGSSTTRLIHLLAGNTKALKDPRSMSPSHDPRKLAVWTLAGLHDVLEEFFFVTYDGLTHTALGASPRDFYEARLAMTGLRAVRVVADDETFFMATLPTTASGRAKIDYRRGIKILGRYYRAPEFRLPGTAGTTVPVRYDPMDVRHAYVFAAGRWVEAWCQELRRFPAISERAVMAISAELDERRRKKNRTAALDALTIATFVSSTKKHELFAKQQRHDAEARAAAGDELTTDVVGPASREDSRLLAEPARRRELPSVLERYDTYD